MAIDDRNGTRSCVYTSEADLVEAIIDWAKPDEETLAQYRAGEIDLGLLVEQNSDYLDTWTDDYHEVDISLWRIITDTLLYHRKHFKQWLKRTKRKGVKT